ncbi:MAG: hypothetical protein ABSG72_07005 [Candidatus Sulfotelmatobacter sp.]|jgi:hypothetical protein
MPNRKTSPRPTRRKKTAAKKTTSKKHVENKHVDSKRAGKKKNQKRNPTPKTAAAKSSASPRKPAAPRGKAPGKSKSIGKTAAAAKPAAITKSRVVRKPVARDRQTIETDATALQQRRSDSAGQAGDLQGLSERQGADSESVDQLLEEGNAFEADVVSGVEAADNADEQEVHTHEVPEDDVPGEYLDEE